jgi:hypothetical protein
MFNIIDSKDPAAELRQYSKEDFMERMSNFYAV